MKKFYNIILLLITCLLLIISCKEPSDITFIPDSKPAKDICARPFSEGIGVYWPKSSTTSKAEVVFYPSDDPNNKKQKIFESERFELYDLTNDREYTIIVTEIEEEIKGKSYKIQCTPKKNFKFEVTPIEPSIQKVLKIIPEEDFDISIIGVDDTFDHRAAMPALKKPTIDTDNNTITFYENYMYKIGLHIVDRKNILYPQTYYEIIDVINIDNVAPVLIDFHGAYNVRENEIFLNWSKPMENDLSYYLLQYNDKDIKLDKSITSYKINNIKPDEKEHTIKLTAYDKVGNLSKPLSCSVIAHNGASILKIVTNKQYYKEPGYNSKLEPINIKISGLNFDLIKKAKDPNIKVGIFGSNDILFKTLKIADIDTLNNTASCTLEIPQIEGFYYVTAKIEGKMSKIKIPLVIVSNPYISHFYVEPNTIALTEVHTDSQALATISGNYICSLFPMTITLKDGNDKQYGESIIIPTPANIIPNYHEEYKISIPIPKESGKYTIYVNGMNYRTPYIHVYENPSFSSLNIPTTSIKYEEGTVKGVLKGKNFTAPNVVVDDFKVTCSDNDMVNRIKLEIVDDVTINVLLRVPGYVTSGDITVSYKDQKITSKYIISE